MHPPTDQVTDKPAVQHLPGPRQVMRLQLQPRRGLEFPMFGPSPQIGSQIGCGQENDRAKELPGRSIHQQQRKLGRSQAFP